MAHDDRIAAGLSFDWPKLPAIRTTLTDADVDVAELRFRRERSSHRGIFKLSKLRNLMAYAVNIEFLEEICMLPNLENLYIDGITAIDLSSLGKLKVLDRLVIVGGTKVKDLDWAENCGSLRTLAIENFPNVTSLDVLAKLESLRAVGVEGSMWRPMRVNSLKPLAALFNLQYLFLTNLRVDDRLLQPLQTLNNLKVLECADYYAKGEMEFLRSRLRNTRCSWFELMDQYGSMSKGSAELVRKVGAAVRASGDSDA